MVNKEAWAENIAAIKELPSYDDIHYYEHTDKMFDALGDDEAEAFDFLKELSQEDKVYLTSIDEEIMAKFPSDDMRQFIHNEVINPAKIRQA